MSTAELGTDRVTRIWIGPNLEPGKRFNHRQSKKSLDSRQSLEIRNTIDVLKNP